VEADYAKREQVQGLEARVQAAEAEAARAAKLEVRVEQAEGFRGGDLKRVTAAEEQLKTLVKTVEGLKAKGGLTDEELSAMKPVQDLAAEVKRVEALLGPAAEAAAAEAKRLEGRVDELAAGKASVADVKFAADTAAGEMDTLKALRKADLDSLGGRIDALERASKTAAGAGAGAGAADDVSGLRAEVKKLEEGLAAVKKASDDAEGALHTRIDKLMVDELRKASNVQGQTLDKLDKKVRKLREAVKALEELAALHDPDGNDPPADAADAADAGAGGAGAVS
jgi:DNA repair exonuclease SbcCD ATPase subunit